MLEHRWKKRGKQPLKRFLTLWPSLGYDESCSCVQHGPAQCEQGGTDHDGRAAQGSGSTVSPDQSHFSPWLLTPPEPSWPGPAPGESPNIRAPRLRLLFFAPSTKHHACLDHWPCPGCSPPHKTCDRSPCPCPQPALMLFSCFHQWEKKRKEHPEPVPGASCSSPSQALPHWPKHCRAQRGLGLVFPLQFASLLPFSSCSCTTVFFLATRHHPQPQQPFAHPSVFLLSPVCGWQR